MNENELHERYIRLAFQYESAIDALLARGLVDEEAADAAKERFYDTLNEEKLRTTQKVRDYHETISLYMRMLAHDGMVSLTELARQYSDESPGYVIQSWMRSRNTLEFYLGADVLSNDGKLIPVHWKGYNDKTKTYQGEVMQKGLIQSKFFNKCKTPENGNQILEYDDNWTEMRLLLNCLFNAFAPSN